MKKKIYANNSIWLLMCARECDCKSFSDFQVANRSNVILICVFSSSSPFLPISFRMLNQTIFDNELMLSFSVRFKAIRASIYLSKIVENVTSKNPKYTCMTIISMLIHVISAEKSRHRYEMEFSKRSEMM